MKTTSFLIVDNNTIALREMSDILKYIGCNNIQQVENANDAWAVMRIKPIECVIAAWDMPDMSGLALLRIARSDDKHFNTPFFLTDPAFTKLKVVQAGQSGVTGLIVAPFDLEIIKKKILSLGQQSVSDIPPAAAKSLEKGLALVENGNYKTAIKVFSSLTEETETAEYYYNIGYKKTAEEKYGEAIEAFRKATQLDRLYAKAYEAMGRAFNAIGKPEEAQRFMQKAADIYMSKEKVEDAEEILNEMLKISPDTINVYNSLGVLYRKKGDLDTALANYKKALKVHPDEPHIHYNIGRLHLEMRDPAKAKDHFGKALKLDPDFREAREVLNALELGTS